MLVHTAWKVSKYEVFMLRVFLYSDWTVIYSVHLRIPYVFSLNTGKYGPEITPYFDTFHAVTLREWAVNIQVIFPSIVRFKDLIWVGH